MLHSHNEAPPTGEKIAQIYTRAKDFYEERVVPHLQRGETVLVVCHQYVLESLALYLSNLPPTAYHSLKLPNGKALSREELVKFRDKESGGAAALRKKINDLSTMWAILLYAAAFLFGSLVRALSASAGILPNLFIAIIVACLAVSTFYTYLDIDFAASQRKVSQAVKSVVYSWMLLRWLVGLFLIFSGFLYQSPADLYKVLWVLFLMVPPALTSPVLSILWGGNLYPSAVLSRTLSIIAPLALFVTFKIGNLPINNSSLSFFVVILILGLAIPGAIAQFWRAKSPVDLNRHSKEWKFIGVLAVAFMALATGFQFIPPTFISDIVFPSNAHPDGSIAGVQELAFATLVFILMRVLAALTLVLSSGRLSKAEAQDAYILLVNPNFFLWAALFSVISQTDLGVKYGVFWAALGFFCIPVIEQILFTTSFSNELLRETLRSSKVATEDVKKLFHQLDVDRSKTLDRSEIMELLGLVEDMTTGERSSEEMRKYITDYLFNILDSDKSDTVDLKELEDYVSTYGLVVNLNVSQ